MADNYEENPEKIENPVFDRYHYKSLLHPIYNFKRFCGDIKQCIQRINRGYSDYDAVDIDNWFLNTIPNMLETFLKINESWGSFPAEFQYEIYEKHKDEIACSYEEYRANCYGKYDSFHEKYDDEAREQWRGIIKRMIFLFKEAHEDYCQRINPYKQGYLKDIKNKEISEKYWKEELLLDEYREKCKNEAFELFSKYFNHLWE